MSNIEIIIKANDGRGRGHIGRVINFLDYSTFKDSLKLIVNSSFADMIPDFINAMKVPDGLWRVNLDMPGNEVYKKIGNAYCADEPIDMSRQNEETDTIRQSIMNYYFKMLDNVNDDTKLIYVDDQNAPETFFPERIAKAIHARSPGRFTKTSTGLAPNAKLAFEIETQIWNPTGFYAMGKNREDCFKKVDYLHLSTDPEFLRNVIGDYDFNGYSDKIIPMGFPINNNLESLYESINENRARKQHLREDLLASAEKGPKQEKTTKLCYVNFGGGAGAEKAIGNTITAAKELDNKTLLFFSNLGGKTEKIFTDLGYEAKQIADNDRGIIKEVDLGGNKKVYLKDHGYDEHQRTLAYADILIQGNGSSTTYEGIKAKTPSINIPLVRPGYEQLIKGLGVEMNGAGKVLISDELQPQFDSFKALRTSYDTPLINVGNPLTPTNIAENLDALIRNEHYHQDALEHMDTFFADTKDTINTIIAMKDGKDVHSIIRNNNLKYYK